MLSRIFFACLLGIFWTAPASAVSLVPLYLEQIIDGAQVAFQGNCISNRTERDVQTGLIVTFTTFQVQDLLKGQTGFTHTIKQIGGSLPGEGGSMEVREMEGVPKFEVGQTYVIFLNGESSAGFSSPVGLGQGTFRVLPGATDRQVSNGRDFREMATSRTSLLLPQATQTKIVSAPGPVNRLGLDEFKQLVRRQVGADK